MLPACNRPCRESVEAFLTPKQRTEFGSAWWKAVKQLQDAAIVQWVTPADVLASFLSKDAVTDVRGRCKIGFTEENSRSAA
jgi:hypothetical protein